MILPAELFSPLDCTCIPKESIAPQSGAFFLFLPVQLMTEVPVVSINLNSPSSKKKA